MKKDLYTMLTEADSVINNMLLLGEAIEQLKAQYIEEVTGLPLEMALNIDSDDSDEPDDFILKGFDYQDFQNLNIAIAKSIQDSDLYIQDSLGDSEEPNIFRRGGHIDRRYNNYLRTLPRNQRNEDPDFNMYRYWELNGKPKNFKLAKERGMFTWNNEDRNYHAGSVAYDLANDRYEFVKSPNHHSVDMELLQYFNSDEMSNFRRDWKLNMDHNPYLYERRKLGDTSLFANGGKVNILGEGGPAFVPDQYSQYVTSPFTYGGIDYAYLPSLYKNDKGISDMYGKHVDTPYKYVYVRKDPKSGKWMYSQVDRDAANIRAYRLGLNNQNSAEEISTWDENAPAASAYDPNSELVRPNIERLLYWDPVNKQIRDRQLSERLSSYTPYNFLTTMIPAYLADPMNYVGAAGEYFRGNGNFFLNALSGNNKGMFSLSDNLSNWADEHPYLSTGVNLLGSAALVGVGALGRNIALKGGIPLSNGYRYHMFLPKGNNFYYRIGDGIAEDAVKRGRIIGRMTEQPFFLKGRSVAGRYSYRGNQDILLRRETGKYEWPQMDWEGNLVDPNNVKTVTLPQGYTVKWNTAGERPILINEGEVTPMINGLIGMADPRDFQLIKPINIKGFNIGYIERPLIK